MKKIEPYFNIFSVIGAIYIYCFIATIIRGGAMYEYLFERFAEGVIYVMIVIAALIASLALFNPIARRFVWFKTYFISRYNILSSKFRYIQEFDFSKEILFEKLLEVLPAAGLEIKQSDVRSGTIFAITHVNWWSNGENIYISLTEVNGKTTLDFCSANVMGLDLIDGNRNKDNYKKMLQEFEESLII